MKKIVSFILACCVVVSILPLTVFAATNTDSEDLIFTYNGHSYCVFDISISWEEAKILCEDIGGHLATITSEEENSFITNLLSKDYYYIGGTDANCEGNWTWVTGEPWTYSNWDTRGANEPNNGNGGDAQNFLAIYGKSTITRYNAVGSWDDAWGITEKDFRNSVGGFICEWDSEYCIPKETISFNGHSYFVYDIPMTWEKANIFCENVGGHLVTITSEDENNFVTSLIKNATKSLYWLGGLDKLHDNNWQWINGEEWNYSNWNSKEPTGGQYCLAIYSDKAATDIDNSCVYGKWIDNPNNGTSGFTIDKMGFICEWDNGITTDEFNEAIYRASYISTNLIGTLGYDFYTREGAAEIMVRCLNENGFAYSAGAWKAFTETIDSLQDIDNLRQMHIEQEDMYSALILETLKASSEIAIVDQTKSNTKVITEAVSLINSCLESSFEYDYGDFTGLREDWKSLSTSDQLEISSELDRKFTQFLEEQVGADYVEISKVFKGFGEALECVDSIETYVEQVLANIQLVSLTDSMKSVLNEMYTVCPDSSPHMKSALKNCIEVINASEDELLRKIVGDPAIKCAGNLVSGMIVDKWWDIVKTKVNIMYPEVGIIFAAYEAGEFLLEYVFNTSDITEQYYKLIAILNLETVIDAVLENTSEKFLANQGMEEAEVFLSAIDLFYSIRDIDCENTLKFCDIADESLAQKIAVAFGAADFSKSRYYINLKRSEYRSNYTAMLENWIDSLRYTDIDLYEKYTGHTILSGESVLKYNKTYNYACPVNVYVYDEQNALVAYVKDGIPYATGNVSIVIDGDEKKIYFADYRTYRIESEGYDVGSMDVTITEYATDGTVVRNANFNQLPVDVDLTYATVTKAESIDDIDYQLAIDEENVVTSDYDSLIPNGDAYNVTITEGYISSNSANESKFEYYSGALFDVTAYIPDGYEFVSWTSNVGAGIFKAPDSITTTVIMPSEDIVISAIFAETDELTSGYCGDNLEWVLYRSGELAISGSGAMWEWTNAEDTPWYCNEKIISVAIDEGVTSVGDYAFEECCNLKEVTIPKSVTRIGEDSLSSLLTITIYCYNGSTAETYAIENGYTFVTLAEVPEPFDLSGVTMTLGSSLSLDFAVDTSKLTGTDNYAEFTIVYADGRSSETVTVPQSEWTAYSGTIYTAKFTGMAAKQMNDVVTAVFHNADGQALTIEKSDSIETYAIRMLNGSAASNKKLRAVYVDMLNYGAAAQAQFEYDEANLANRNLTDAHKAWATTSVTTTDNRVKGTGYVGSTLTLAGEIQLDLVFNNSAVGTDYSSLYAIATYTDHYGNVKSIRVEGADFIKYSSTLCQVSITGMAVADFRSVVSCTVYNQEGVAIANAADSIESYANRNAASLGAMVDSIVKFGASSYNYFH